MKTDLKSIDPVLGLMDEFSRHTRGTVAHIQKMRQEAIFTDGAVPAKLKALAAVVWSVSARCEPCIKYYASRATAHGASEAELGEYLAVASAMGGCVGEMWALKAYKAFKDGKEGAAPQSENPSCCT